MVALSRGVGLLGRLRLGVVRRRFLSVAAGGEPEGAVVVDIRGDGWVKKRSKDGGPNEFFWYNEANWETRNDKPPTATDGLSQSSLRPEGVVKPQYATDWYDSRFPEWVQYVEFNSKRKYYFNSATREVTWAHPESPTRDTDAIFRKEVEEQTRSLKKIPATTKPAPFWRRAAAVQVDFVLSFLAGCAMGGLVYIDLEDIPASQLAIAVTTWSSFIARDMIFESGTRSPGKRLLKLELVRMDGQLPTRWNTGFRNVYLPAYTVAAIAPPAAFALTAVDLGLLLFTRKSQRLGDVIGRTWVVDEQPDRRERMDEKTARDKEDDLRGD